MSSHEREDAELIDRISSAFAAAPYPGDNNIIVNVNDLESQDIAKAFRGYHWRSLRFDTIFYHRDSLPFLSPQAFRFYLPAYLITAIRHYEDGDTLFEFVVYQLTPPRDKRDKREWKWFRQNVEVMNAAQSDAICRFLEYVQRRYPNDFPNGEPQYALDTYWRQSAEGK